MRKQYIEIECRRVFRSRFSHLWNFYTLYYCRSENPGASCKVAISSFKFPKKSHKKQKQHNCMSFSYKLPTTYWAVDFSLLFRLSRPMQSVENFSHVERKFSSIVSQFLLLRRVFLIYAYSDWIYEQVPHNLYSAPECNHWICWMKMEETEGIWRERERDGSWREKQINIHIYYTPT